MYNNQNFIRKVSDSMLFWHQKMGAMVQCSLADVVLPILSQPMQSRTMQSRRQCSPGDNVVQTIQSRPMQSKRQCSLANLVQKTVQSSQFSLRDNVVWETIQSRQFSPGQCSPEDNVVQTNAVQNTVCGRHNGATFKVLLLHRHINV